MKKNNELIKQWLIKAKHDLGTAKLTLENEPEFSDIICFHAQQAVEKYLKAYMIYLNLEPIKTHNLSYLLDLIKEEDKNNLVTDSFYEKIEQLEGYSVEIRYPDEYFEPSFEEAKKAFQISLEIKNIIERVIIL